MILAADRQLPSLSFLLPMGILPASAEVLSLALPYFKG
jgi:hypothetical protein